MKTPDYLYRPNDFTIFEKIENGKYIVMDKATPKYISNEYSYDVLISHDFKSCTEDDFPRLKKKRDFYYEYTGWSGRPDGHGGSKGGTIKEFLEYKERVKRWKKSQNEEL